MVGDIVINIAANTAQATSALRSLQMQAQQFAGALKSMLAGYLSFAGIRTAVSAAEEFEQAFRRAMSIAQDVTPAVREQAREAVQEAARATGYYATEAAAALYELHSAGLKTEAALKALPQTLTYARAAGVEPGLGVKQIVNTLSALGLLGKTAEETGRNFSAMADLIAHASRLASTTAAELGEALSSHAAAAAAAANQSVFELVGTLTFFAARGRQGAEAGTMYRMVLSDLRDSAQKNVEVWQQLGISFYDAQGNVRPLSQIMADLGGRLRGMSAAERDAVAASLGLEQRTRDMILQMALGASELQQFVAAMQEAGGAAAKMAAQQMTPLQRMWKDFHASLEKLGEGFMTVLISLNPLVELLGQMLTFVGGALQHWAPLTAAIITFVIITRGVPAVIAVVVKSLRTLATASAVAQAIIAGPAGLAKVLIGLAGAAGVYVLVDQAFAKVSEDMQAQTQAMEKSKKEFSELTQEINKTAKAVQQSSAINASWRPPKIKQISGLTWEERKSGALQFLEQSQRLEGPEKLIATLEDLQTALANLDVSGATWVFGPEVRVGAGQLQQAIARVNREIDQELGGLQEAVEKTRLEIELRKRGLDDLAVEAEMHRRRRQELGLSTAIVDQWLAAEREKQAVLDQQRRIQQEQEERIRRAQDIQRSLLTPLEEYEQKIQEVMDLWQRGLLSVEQMHRWIAAERERIAGRQLEEARRVAGMRAGAIAYGTTEAYSTILRASIQSRTAGPEEKTARNTQAMLERLDRIERALKQQEAI